MYSIKNIPGRFITYFDEATDGFLVEYVGEDRDNTSGYVYVARCPHSTFDRLVEGGVDPKEAVRWIRDVFETAKA